MRSIGRSRSNRHGRTPNGGWNLVESMIAVGLMGTLLVSASRALNGALGLYRTTSAQIELDRRVDRLGTRLANELTTTSATSLQPVLVEVAGGPTAWTDTLDYAQVTRWQDGDVVLGPARRLGLRLETGELDDGIDQDGDGLVDERVLTLTHDVGTADERTLVLARGVLEWFPGETADGTDENANGLEDEPGFSVTNTDGFLSVRIALGAPLPDGRVSIRTRVFSIALQN